MGGYISVFDYSISILFICAHCIWNSFHAASDAQLFSVLSKCGINLLMFTLKACIARCCVWSSQELERHLLLTWTVVAKKKKPFEAE